jgi:hypothetical protein
MTGDVIELQVFHRFAGAFRAAHLHGPSRGHSGSSGGRCQSNSRAAHQTTEDEAVGFAVVVLGVASSIRLPAEARFVGSAVALGIRGATDWSKWLFLPWLLRMVAGARLAWLRLAACGHQCDVDATCADDQLSG